MLKKVFLNFLIICGVSAASVAQPDKNNWVDSVFNSLNIDEKIGQIVHGTDSIEHERGHPK